MAAAIRYFLLVLKYMISVERFSTSGRCNTLLPTSTQDHHSTHTRLGEEVQYLWPLQHVTLYEYSRSPQHTHKARGKAQNNFSYVSQLDILSHTSTHT